MLLTSFRVNFGYRGDIRKKSSQTDLYNSYTLLYFILHGVAAVVIVLYDLAG